MVSGTRDKSHPWGTAVIVRTKETASSWRKGYVLCLRSVPSLDQAYENARVSRGTYAGDLVESIYSQVFRTALDLKRDYGLYFGLEYDSFGEYLLKRHWFENAVIEALVSAEPAAAVVIHYVPSHSFLADDEGAAYLKAILAPKEEE